MVVKCVYCGKTRGVGNITLHKFPLKEKDVLDLWLKNIDLGASFVPTQSMRLCSKHFMNDCFYKTTNAMMLLANSIPTIFTRYKSECVYCKKKKNERENRSFHKFPLNNKDVLNQWLQNIGLLNFIPTDSSLLCSDHFEDNSYYYKQHGKTLKKTAIPRKLTGLGTLDPVDINAVVEDIGCIEPLEKRFRDNRNVCVATSPASTVLIEPTTTITFNDGTNISPFESNSNPSHSPAIPNMNIQNNNETNIEYTVVSSKELQKKLTSAYTKIHILRQTLRTRQQKIRRMGKRISSFKEIVSELRKVGMISESGLTSLESIVDADIAQLLNRFLKNNRKGNTYKACNNNMSKHARRKCLSGISREMYPGPLRSSAFTLHFYSPKAYNFVREKFCNALPDSRTIRSWYSSANGEPGFTSESFEVLKAHVSDAESRGSEILVALMLDEIGIKKGLQNSPNGTVRGYVDIGSHSEITDKLLLAKDALVLMVVSITSNWKLPIGYFLINGIDYTTIAALITDAISRLQDIKVRVVSLTLDGPSQHFATMRLLGANFDIDNPKPFFPNPVTSEKVYVIFDACHMLKLMRNCLAEHKILQSENGNFIKWQYIVSLAEIQQKGLRAGNKLKAAHIEYQKMKMKVSLAAQTLSSSVADSIKFCSENLRLPQFEGGEETVRFMQCIDRLFDFLNSRNPLAKNYKAPLKRSNESLWRNQISSEVDYLKGITDINSVPMWKTRRYVPFVGFITAVQAVIDIFETFVKPTESPVQYLLMYKLSQDHLELFFCAIRSCGGWCPNPTCSQFISAYRRLLMRHMVEASNGNAVAMDITKILHISSAVGKKKSFDVYDSSVFDNMANIRVSKKYGLDNVNYTDHPMIDLEEFLDFQSKLPEELSEFSRCCASYIGGWVVKKLIDAKRSIVKCETCRFALVEVSDEDVESEAMLLIKDKTRGGLLFPSPSVIEICSHAEILIRHALNRNKCMTPSERNFPAVLCSKVLHDLIQSPCTLFPSLYDHMFDDSADETNHIYLLTKQVCQTYIKVRLFAATKLATESVVGEKVRHNLTRQIIWQHQ